MLDDVLPYELKAELSNAEGKDLCEFGRLEAAASVPLPEALQAEDEQSLQTR